jgi:hypothetical protein
MVVGNLPAELTAWFTALTWPLQRKALQRHCIQSEITQEAHRRPLSRKTRRLFQSLVQLLG